MFKILVLLFPLLSLCAAPIGNGAAPALLEEGVWTPDTFWTNGQLSVTFDTLFTKKMKAAPSSPLQNLEEAEVQAHAQFASLIWNIQERLDVQIDLGASRCQWNWIQDGMRLEGTTQPGLLWGANARCLLFAIKETLLSVYGQVGGWSFLKGVSTLQGVPLSETAYLHQHEWQAGATLSQKIGCFIPYFGWMTNQTFFSVSQSPNASARLHAKIVSGPFIGCTLTKGTILSLNVEWRSWFEEGLAFSGQVRF